MQRVTKENLEALCRDVLRKAPALLDGVAGPGERNEILLRALYERVCKHLNLDPAEQARSLGRDPGFLLMQTIEEHMEPEFPYANVLDEELLIKVQNL